MPALEEADLELVEDSMPELECDSSDTEELDPVTHREVCSFLSPNWRSFQVLSTSSPCLSPAPGMTDPGAKLDSWNPHQGNSDMYQPLDNVPNSHWRRHMEVISHQFLALPGANSLSALAFTVFPRANWLSSYHV